ncbi:MAG: tetratricopeptide repeat protein [Planctomycetota bacterium]
MRSALLLSALAAAAAAVWWATTDPAPTPEPPETVQRGAVAPRVAVHSGSPATLEPDAGDAERAPWVDLNNRAVGLSDEGRLDEAIELLERCVAALPDDETFRVNLARLLVRRATDAHGSARGDYAQAIEDLARAIELDPGDESLVDLLERWRRQAELEEGFAGYSSEHFNVRYDADRDDLRNGVQELVDVLERAYSDLWLMTGHDPVLESGEPIQIVIYKRDDFLAATGLGHWAGGAYDGSIRLPIGNLEAERAAWTETLRHELTHAFVASLGGVGVPGWLNEGFAQWFEGDRDRRLRRARERVGRGPLFTLEELSGSLARLGEAEAIARAYAQSLLLVDHLERFYGERLLGALIEACGQDSSPQERFQERRGFGLDDVVSDLADELAGF